MGDFLVTLISILNWPELLTWINWPLHPERKTGHLRMAHRLEWERKKGGLCGLDMERTLRKYGVPVWGRGERGKCHYCYVPGQQAEWAEELLRRRLAGEPLPIAWADGGKKRR